MGDSQGESATPWVAIRQGCRSMQAFSGILEGLQASGAAM
jgi:hypothetical protein